MRRATTSRPLRLAGLLLGVVALLALLAAPGPMRTAPPQDAALALAAGHMAMDDGGGTSHGGDCCDVLGHTAAPHCAACLIAVEAGLLPVAGPSPAAERLRVSIAPASPPGGPGLPPKPPRLA